ncbi:MAG: hypothetical protein LBQ95_03620 [Lachnospiraceae bacterium]|jgi:hypothetical protein|nr:hypothetical protein [Lachnospiraceae bacterium]
MHKKKNKTIGKLLAALLIVIALVPSISVFAADGKISFTDPATKVGDMVQVRVVARSTAGNFGQMSVSLKYDATALGYQGGAGVTKNGDGALTLASAGGAAEVAWDIQFQGLTQTTTKVEVASADIKNEAGAAMTLDFGNSTVSIAAGDPSKIIEPAGGGSADGIAVTVNGTEYTFTNNYPEADIPEGFTKKELQYDGVPMQVLVNETNMATIGYLVDATGAGDFFLYDDEAGAFAPYGPLKISETTTIVVLSNTSQVSLPNNYSQVTLTLNGKEFPVWQDMDKNDIYVLYAISGSGDRAYYQYDKAEDTYQRFDVPVEEAVTEEPKTDTSIQGKIKAFINDHFKIVAIAGLAVLLIFLVLLLILGIKLHNRNAELDELYDEYGIDEEPEPLPKSKQAPAAPKKPEKRKTEREREFEDFDDLDDYDEEDDYFEDDYPRAKAPKNVNTSKPAKGIFDKNKRKQIDNDDFEEDAGFADEFDDAFDDTGDDDGDYLDIDESLRKTKTFSGKNGTPTGGFGETGGFGATGGFDDYETDLIDLD